VDRERRKGMIPVPDNLNEMLNKPQRQALSGIEYTGWELRFLRRPLFQDPVLVVQNLNDGKIGVLDKGGSVKVLAGIKVRKQGSRKRITPSTDPLVWTN
jgi:hypothetical protein